MVVHLFTLSFPPRTWPCTPARDGRADPTAIRTQPLRPPRHLPPTTHVHPHSRGRFCVNGSCFCRDGYSGADCATELCPGSCSFKGKCVGGACACYDGWGGDDCAFKTCRAGCHGNGVCMANATCRCNEGYSEATDCEFFTCPNDCSGRGVCNDGTCYCQPSAVGADCSGKACPNGCNGNGVCDAGRCMCTQGFRGASCAEVDPVTLPHAFAAAPESMQGAMRRVAATIGGAGRAPTAGKHTSRLLASDCSMRCASGCSKAQCAQAPSGGCYSSCVLQCVPECLERAAGLEQLAVEQR